MFRKNALIYIDILHSFSNSTISISSKMVLSFKLCLKIVLQSGEVIVESPVYKKKCTSIIRKLIHFSYGSVVEIFQFVALKLQLSIQFKCIFFHLSFLLLPLLQHLHYSFVHHHHQFALYFYACSTINCICLNFCICTWHESKRCNNNFFHSFRSSHTKQGDELF